MSLGNTCSPLAPLKVKDEQSECRAIPTTAPMAPLEEYQALLSHKWNSMDISPLLPPNYLLIQGTQK